MLALLVGGAPAYATEPLTTSGHVTDPDGFLSADERAHLESDAESLRSTYGVIIDAVVVPNFSDQKPSVWCQATLEKSRTQKKASSTLFTTRMAQTPIAQMHNLLET